MFKIINKIKEKITTRFSSKKTKNLLEKELKNDKISKEKNKIKKTNKILKFSILPLVLFFPIVALASVSEYVEGFFLSLV
jgi:nitrate reductase NapE component